MFIYRGNWVVDVEGDYCKVDHLDSRGNVWGHWSCNPDHLLCTKLDWIVGKYRTKKQAVAVADIIRGVE